MYIYIYVYICVYIYVYIYIYITGKQKIKESFPAGHHIFEQLFTVWTNKYFGG